LTNRLGSQLDRRRNVSTIPLAFADFCKFTTLVLKTSLPVWSVMQIARSLISLGGSAWAQRMVISVTHRDARSNLASAKIGPTPSPPTDRMYVRSYSRASKSLRIGHF